YVFDFSAGAKNEYLRLNLNTELQKGAHYFNIAEIEREIKKPIMPLLLNMKRLVLFEFQPLPDQHPEVVKIVQEIFRNGAGGTLKPHYFSKRFWLKLKEDQEAIRSEFQRLGKLQSLHLIETERRNGADVYRFV